MRKFVIFELDEVKEESNWFGWCCCILLVVGALMTMGKG